MSLSDISMMIILSGSDLRNQSPSLLRLHSKSFWQQLGLCLHHWSFVYGTKVVRCATSVYRSGCDLVIIESTIPHNIIDNVTLQSSNTPVKLFQCHQTLTCKGGNLGLGMRLRMKSSLVPMQAPPIFSKHHKKCHFAALMCSYKQLLILLET